MRELSLPVDNSEFDAYARKILAIPILQEEEEHHLIDRWFVHRDISAAQRLVEAYLRLVVKVTVRFRNYGFPLMDLASEGNIGLMKAIKNFDPTLGHGIATYAIWWIKAAINEYIIKSWSIVKIGTTAAQRKLFFNLRKLKNSGSVAGLDEHQVAGKISEMLEVSKKDVEEMERILNTRDISLNMQLGEDGGSEVHDVIPASEVSHEVVLSETQERRMKNRLLYEAVESLERRHREIFVARSLSAVPRTLKELGEKFSISQERVRQIHARAMKKVTEYVEEHGRKLGIV